MKIFFSGICGVSMSALAVLSAKFGYEVMGSDLNFKSKPECLKSINVSPQPCLELIENADLVVFSSAVKEDNDEMIYAKENKKKILSRGEFLGCVSSNFDNVIAVAGSHGKTTTTAMIYHALLMSGKSPTLHLGGEMISNNSNVVFGSCDYFITEACEYHDNFLFLKPDFSVITNIEPEHLDYFKTFENQKKSFEIFKRNSEVCVDKLTFQAKNIRTCKNGKTSFSLIKNGINLNRIKLKIGGKHNVQNALFCLEICLKIGLNIQQVIFALQTFKGVKKRLEKINSTMNFPVYVDYAHHPEEIRQVAKYFKSFHKGKVIVVFQPHTYSRTKNFFNEFLESLNLFDEVVLFKSFSARESESQGFSEKKLFEGLKERGKECFVFFDEQILKSFLLRYDESCLVAFLGAGDLPQLMDFS